MKNHIYLSKGSWGLVILSFFWLSVNYAQVSLDYYLPEISYNENIPTPQSVLGFEVGEMHVSHTQLVQYMKVLAAASDRVEIQEYAQSYENRPLLLLTISSRKNIENIEEIQKEHLKLSNPKAKSVKVKDMPAVVWLGNSIHGNEPSGGNSSLLVAYYLAAGESKEIEAILENTIVLLDPCFNPDGFNRFASWVNTHKGHTPNPDAQNRELNEVWPGGRTNHYWFDLNRDWLLVQHPESRGRIKMFHQWKPNILTDAHEMGSNSTYFFQPGIPSRNSPLTPESNFELTKELANHHAEALDSIGSFYYCEESFDDFYIGKGSTYPDVNGGVGILFEQASSRGHYHESVNGPLTFPFTIRNQFNTSVSTLKGALADRVDLLEHQRTFYKDTEKNDNQGAYVFGSSTQKSQTKALLDLLMHHSIKVYQSNQSIDVEGITFEENSAYVVPLQQSQQLMIRGIFETQKEFKDSLFYDVSTWTMPLAFNLPSKKTSIATLGKLEEVKSLPKVDGRIIGKQEEAYAYAIPAGDYFIYPLIYELQKEAVLLKVGTRPFEVDVEGDTYSMDYGTVLIPIGQDVEKRTKINRILQEHLSEYGGMAYAIKSGLTVSGIDLGSPSFEVLRMPKIGLVVGESVNAYEAGEIWHLLDYRMNIPITLLDMADFGSANWSKYNVLIMPSGTYASINQGKMRSWLQSGGVLITQRNATKWLASSDFCSFEKKEKTTLKDKTRKPYESKDRRNGAQHIGGSIFEAKADLTHPLLYGYQNEYIPLFRNHKNVFRPTNNVYATPLVYTNQPLLSGYVSKDNLNVVKGSAALMVGALGKGRMIGFVDNPNFRAFWYGTNPLFMNAIFFGHTIDSQASE